MNCKTTDNNFEVFCKELPTMVGQHIKFCFLEPLNPPASSLCDYIFLKKINKESKNTNSQWSFPFQKIQPCKLLQAYII